jgi:hypothetical protein
MGLVTVILSVGSIFDLSAPDQQHMTCVWSLDLRPVLQLRYVLQFHLL